MSSPGLKQGSRVSNPGVPQAIRSSNGSIFGPMPVTGDGAFGEVVTGEITPMVQRDFIYGGHDDEVEEIVDGGGSVSYSDAQGVVSTAAAVGSLAILQSDRAMRYRPGQGAGYRFTTVFPDGAVTGVRQVVGALGGGANGLFVGYNESDSRFGVCRQAQGVQHLETLQVTTPAGGAETVTVTLNGQAYAVPVTAGTAEENTQELAEFDYGVDWKAEASGDTVYFVAHKAGPRGGVYSVVSTGALVGSVATPAAGASPTEQWEYQGSFNLDPLDGTGPSKMVLDPSNGNIWRIKMQFLGYGAMEFQVKDPTSQQFIPVHVFTYTNQNTVPNSSNPSYKMGLWVECVSAGAVVSAKSASMVGYVEGPFRVLGPDHGDKASDSVGQGSTIPVLSVRCNETHANGVARRNLREILPALISVGCSNSNRAVQVELVLNGVLSNPLWEDYGNTHSYAAVDKSATAISGGDALVSLSVSGAAGSLTANLRDIEISVRPGDILSIVIAPTGNAVDYTAGLSWKEDS